ncbi:MAG: hypothetical protein QOH56_2793 [Pseudonocardiales bacterium]|nr:hypothetical protein [Pseudonocardiales bacterium]
MANYTVALATHRTLGAAVVDVVTISPHQYSNVEVLNRDAAAYLFFRTDGTAPTVAGDDCYVVGPGAALRVPHPNGQPVKLISASAIAYSVTATDS